MEYFKGGSRFFPAYQGQIYDPRPEEISLLLELAGKHITSDAIDELADADFWRYRSGKGIDKKLDPDIKIRFRQLRNKSQELLYLLEECHQDGKLAEFFVQLSISGTGVYHEAPFFRQKPMIKFMSDLEIFNKQCNAVYNGKIKQSAFRSFILQTVKFYETFSGKKFTLSNSDQEHKTPGQRFVEAVCAVNDRLTAYAEATYKAIARDPDGETLVEHPKNWSRFEENEIRNACVEAKKNLKSQG